MAAALAAAPPPMVVLMGRQLGQQATDVAEVSVVGRVLRLGLSIMPGIIPEVPIP